MDSSESQGISTLTRESKSIVTVSEELYQTTPLEKYLSLLTRQWRIVETTTINEYLLLCKNGTWVNTRKGRVGNKKAREKHPKGQKFSAVEILKPLPRIPTYTHLSLLMFFRAGVPIPN